MGEEDDSQIRAPLTVVLVNTEQGLVPIEQVEPRQMIRTPYGMRRIVGTRVREKIPMVSLRLSNGITMRVPHSRQFRSRNTWVEAGALSRGTPVYMSGTPGVFGG